MEYGYQQDYALRCYIGSEIKAKRKAAGWNRKTLAICFRHTKE